MAFTFSPLTYSALSGSIFASPILESFTLAVTVNFSSTGAFALKLAVSSVFFSTVSSYVVFVETS